MLYPKLYRDDITITNVNGSTITMVQIMTQVAEHNVVTLPNGHQISYRFNYSRYCDNRSFYYLVSKTESVNGKSLVTTYGYTGKTDTIHKRIKTLKSFLFIILQK